MTYERLLHCVGRDESESHEAIWRVFQKKVCHETWFREKNWRSFGDWHADVFRFAVRSRWFRCARRQLRLQVAGGRSPFYCINAGVPEGLCVEPMVSLQPFALHCVWLLFRSRFFGFVFWCRRRSPIRFVDNFLRLGISAALSRRTQHCHAIVSNHF